MIFSDEVSNLGFVAGNMTSSITKRLLLLIAFIGSFAAHLAGAATFGGVNVKSVLGQNLRAELEVIASTQELEAMSVALAPQSAFERAEVSYSPSLKDLRFQLSKDAGRSFVLITSEKPVRDPFIDFLLELKWANGNLVREYTFLLPISVLEKAADPSRGLTLPKAGAAPASAPSTPSPIVVKSKVEPAPTNKVVENRKKPPVLVAAPAPPSPRDQRKRKVKYGETLSLIAKQARQDGEPEVLLEQMLVALFQQNRDKFVAQNMNRLKTGVVLSIPDKADALSISPKQAKKIVLAQYQDWQTYQHSLATTVAQQRHSSPKSSLAETSRVSAGKITGRVNNGSPMTQGNRDQLKVSGSSGRKGGGGPSEEDWVAKDKALRDANQRIDQLRRNLHELEKLLELKNQSLAVLQKQVGSPSTAKQATGVPSAQTKPNSSTATTSKLPLPPPSGQTKSNSLLNPDVPEKPKPRTSPVNPDDSPSAPADNQPSSDPSEISSVLDSPYTWAGGAALAIAAVLFLFAQIRGRSSRYPVTTKASNRNLRDSVDSSLVTRPGKYSPDMGKPEPRVSQPGFDYASVNLDLAPGGKTGVGASKDAAKQPPRQALTGQSPAPAADKARPGVRSTVQDGDLDNILHAPAQEFSLPSARSNSEGDTEEKLALARAYIEMNDHESAKTLISEVMREGTPKQVAEAQALLASIARR